MSETVQTTINMVGSISVMEQELSKLPIPPLLNPNPLESKSKLPHERYFQK